MAIAVKDNTVYAVEIEVTEGTYVPPSSATESYVQVLTDGAEMTPAKDLLEREIFNGSIGKTTPRTGMRSVTGALPTEMRAAEVEGDAPEFDALIRSALGLRRQVTTTTADDTDSGTSHTAQRIYLLDADGSKYAVGDCITVKVTGDYHTSPITAVSSAGGDSYVDLLIPAAGAFSDGDVIMAVTTYVTANSGHPSLSVSKYLETSRLDQAAGCRVNNFSLENFSTGQLASFNFGFEGLNFDQTITAQPHSPDYDDSLPPIILDACVYQDATQIHVNEFAFSVENTLGFATSTCSPNGKISGRVTERTVTGSFNPYKQDDDVSNFDKFNNNTEFSLFAQAHNPTSTSGEYDQVVAMYMPNCISTEISESDQDGLLQEGISYSAGRGADGTAEEIFISFS